MFLTSPAGVIFSLDDIPKPNFFLHYFASLTSTYHVSENNFEFFYQSETLTSFQLQSSDSLWRSDHSGKNAVW